jgi:hypothetical protein
MCELWGLLSLGPVVMGRFAPINVRRCSCSERNREVWQSGFLDRMGCVCVDPACHILRQLLWSDTTAVVVRACNLLCAHGVGSYEAW